MLTNLRCGSNCFLKGATMTSPVGLSQIAQIAIVAHDIDRSVEFYRDRLRLPFLFRAGQLAFFDAGGVRLMLTPAEKPELDHAASILYFRVSDIGSAYAEIKGRGVRFEDEPHMIARLADREVWMCHF